MKMLLTNDDGIHSEGMWALYSVFSQKHAVTVVAPDRQRSGVGHGISLENPLRVERITINGFSGYAVNGTPADCVKLGVLEVMGEKPGLVVSGLNPGANLGINLNYSGTVAAAREATLLGIPAIAASTRWGKRVDYDAVARVIAALSDRILSDGLPDGTFLNVNVPCLPESEIKGVRVSRQNMMPLSNSMEKRADPWNRPYYWQSNEGRTDGSGDDLDSTVLDRDYVSITPIKCDMTDYGAMEALRSWNRDLTEWENLFSNR